MSLQKNKPIVFIVDDDKEICESLKWLLESVGLIPQIFNNGPDFLALFKPIELGCILLDIRMPMMSGLELQEQLNIRKNKLPIIFLTGHGDVPMAVRAMKAGAYDFIIKPYNDQALLEQIQKAIINYQKEASDYKNHDTANSRFKLLTVREREIMRLITNGKMNKEVANSLGISMKTVEMHRAHVMEKMGVKTLAELVKIFLNIEETA